MFVKFCVTPLLTSTPCVGPHPMSTPPVDHPATPTVPRVSAEPEESIHPSPQHLRSPSLEDADLRLIQARHSQGRPLQPPPTDPASPEVDEPWYSDPGASVDRGGWENPKPRNQETPKQSAPLTTSTPQSAPRRERPPSPQQTPTPTRTSPPGIDPHSAARPATSSSPGGPLTAEMPSLQELVKNEPIHRSPGGTAQARTPTTTTTTTQTLIDRAAALPRRSPPTRHREQTRHSPTPTSSTTTYSYINNRNPTPTPAIHLHPGTSARGASMPHPRGNDSQHLEDPDSCFLASRIGGNR